MSPAGVRKLKWCGKHRYKDVSVFWIFPAGVKITIKVPGDPSIKFSISLDATFLKGYHMTATALSEITSSTTKTTSRPECLCATKQEAHPTASYKQPNKQELRWLCNVVLHGAKHISIS